MSSSRRLQVSQALETVVGRKINLEFTQKLRTMSTLFGQSLIAMDYVKTIILFSEKLELAW